MSETAETLRSALWELAQATGRRAKEAWHGNAMAAFDTLISEHRAEIEDAQATAAIESANKATSDRDTARDAELEEVALYFKDSEPGTTWGVNEAVSEVRALKSQPARQYVDAEKVREVLPYLRTVCGLSEQEVSEVLHRLGVDLDAEGECAGYECDVVPGDPCATCGLPFTQHPEHSP